VTRNRKRLLLGGAAAVFVVATFVFFLPRLAAYEDVWGVLQQLSWGWVLALAAATLLNLATFAPPWQVALPGLRFMPAIEVTQASTALSIVVPGGVAAATAATYGMLRRLGFAGTDIARALTLVGLWNQFLNLFFPVLAAFLLTASGEQARLLATAAFIGVAVLGVAIAGFTAVMVSDNLARDIGDLAARLATWALGRLHRGPVHWNGASFERFRDSAVELLRRRWHVLTLVSLAGSLSVFLVLLVSLRALGVHESQVSTVEAFAAWALVRLLATIPITPGDIGVVELGLTTTLVAFGGPNAAVVAAVLVYRFLTMVPNIVLGLIAAGTWRRHSRAAAGSSRQGEDSALAAAEDDAVSSTEGGSR
jgi:putative heme transporter